MSIEIKFNTVTISPQDIQEKYPELISVMNSYLPAKKIRKRRRARRTQKLVTALINDIIDSIDTEYFFICYTPAYRGKSELNNPLLYRQ